MEVKESRFRKVKTLFNSPDSPNPVFVELPTLAIEEPHTGLQTPKANVKFTELPDEVGRPLIEQVQVKSEDENDLRVKKPFKVQYFRDEKSLQFSIDFQNPEKPDTGLFSQLGYCSFYQACFGEFIGTYILVLFAVGFGLNTSPDDTSSNFTGALVTGLLIATLVWCLAQVSGCNINPAVSLALLLSGDTNIVRVLFYVPCQLLGACFATLTLRGMVIEQSVVAGSVVNGTSQPILPPQIGLTLLNPSISPMQGIAIELLITFFLIMTIFSCIDKNRKDLGGSFPLTVGFSVTVGALMGGQFTGGSMNPARSFGPALMAGNLTDHYVYWIGPCGGAVLAAIVYKVLTFKSSVRVVK